MKYQNNKFFRRPDSFLTKDLFKNIMKNIASENNEKSIDKIDNVQVDRDYNDDKRGECMMRVGDDNSQR